MSHFTCIYALFSLSYSSWKYVHVQELVVIHSDRCTKVCFFLAVYYYVCVPTPPPSNFWQYMQKQSGKAWAISSKEWCQCLLWWTEERRAPDQLHSTVCSLSWTVNSKCLTSRTFRTTLLGHTVQENEGSESFRLLPFSVYQGEHWLNLFMQQDLTDHPSPLLHTASN